MSNSLDESEIPLELFDPKSVFFRNHTDQKVFHYVNRYFSFRGVVVRSLDKRHEILKEPKRATNCTCENWRCTCEEYSSKRIKTKWSKAKERTRMELVENDPYGLDSFEVSYSLSKKQRWQLAAEFEHKAAKFQVPHQNLSCVLATSEHPLLDAWWGPRLFDAPSRHSIYVGPSSVKKLIACNEDGSLYVRENAQSNGHSYTYLPALPSTSNSSFERPLSKNKKRALRRKQREEGMDQSKEPPVRITYYAYEPKTTAHFMNGANKDRWPRIYTQNSSTSNKPWKLGGEFVEMEEESLDFDSMETEEQGGEELQSPPLMTLGDFIRPTESDYIYVESDVYVDCDGFVYF
ncbi:Cytochrome P450 [Aphelenchoides besseyi]|nr:Cytochrome P450 [Aphelenchoides besseyi]KAI6195402.1 Cytochrome P450 [Aphelenchoides besseyi]